MVFTASHTADTYISYMTDWGSKYSYWPNLFGGGTFRDTVYTVESPNFECFATTTLPNVWMWSCGRRGNLGRRHSNTVFSLRVLVEMHDGQMQIVGLLVSASLQPRSPEQRPCSSGAIQTPDGRAVTSSCLQRYRRHVGGTLSCSSATSRARKLLCVELYSTSPRTRGPRII